MLVVKAIMGFIKNRCVIWSLCINVFFQFKCSFLSYFDAYVLFFFKGTWKRTLFRTMLAPNLGGNTSSWELVLFLLMGRGTKPNLCRKIIFLLNTWGSIFFLLQLWGFTLDKRTFPQCEGSGRWAKATNDLTAVGKLLSKNIKRYDGSVAGYPLIVCALPSQQIQTTEEKLPV